MDQGVLFLCFHSTTLSRHQDRCLEMLREDYSEIVGDINMYMQLADKVCIKIELHSPKNVKMHFGERNQGLQS